MAALAGLEGLLRWRVVGSCREVVERNCCQMASVLTRAFGWLRAAARRSASSALAMPAFSAPAAGSVEALLAPGARCSEAWVLSSSASQRLLMVTVRPWPAGAKRS